MFSNEKGTWLHSLNQQGGKDHCNRCIAGDTEGESGMKEALAAELFCRLGAGYTRMAPFPNSPDVLKSSFQQR